MVPNLVFGVLMIAVGVALVVFRRAVISINRKVAIRIYGKAGEKMMSSLTVPLVVGVGAGFFLFGVFLLANGITQLVSG